MLSSFFRTSKPIHYIICLLMMAILVGYHIITAPLLGWNLIWVPLVAMVTVALFQFITLKNDLTAGSSYSLWIYSCTLIISLLYFTNVQSIAAYFLIILALRRLISMRSGRGLVRKIFDASFFIAIASLFYSWSILFFIVIFLSIVIYAFKSLNNWIIPFIAASCVALLTFTLDQYAGTNFLSNIINDFRFGINFSEIEINYKLVIPFLTGCLGLLYSVLILLGYPKISLSSRSRFSLLGFTGLCACFIYVLDGNALFLVPIISIFTARFIQEIDHKGVKESLLWIPFLTMIVLFIVNF